MKHFGAVIITLLALFFQYSALSAESVGSIRVVTVFKTENSWDDKPIIYPEGKAEVTGLLIEIAVGGETGWHSHPTPSFAVVLDGDLEVKQKNGSTKHVKSGDGFAEVVNTPHNGRNVGSVPVKLVVFYAGAVGQKLTIKESAP